MLLAFGFPILFLTFGILATGLPYYHRLSINKQIIAIVCGWLLVPALWVQVYFMGLTGMSFGGGDE